MPLSPPDVEREHIHTRRYEFEGYRRADGLWDIEGRITDTKSYGFDNEFRGHIEPGVALHDMSVRLTIDDDFVVRDVEAQTDAGPYAVCPAVTPNFKRLIGAQVARGWRRRLLETVGGVEGCTHITEMLGAMATVAFQTLYPMRARMGTLKPKSGKPGLIDSCHTFRSDGEVVQRTWPDYYTGEQPEAETGTGSSRQTGR